MKIFCHQEHQGTKGISVFVFLVSLRSWWLKDIKDFGTVPEKG